MPQNFTASNVLDVQIIDRCHDGVDFYYHIGNTDSDVGTVVLRLSSTGHGNYDADIAVDCECNWGLFASAQGVRVAVEHFMKTYSEKFPICDNTGITSV